VAVEQKQPLLGLGLAGGHGHQAEDIGAQVPQLAQRAGVLD
jgi:hypothetical protein